jgi:Domain of unknown function (DUF222)/HNH endonuclease
MFETPGSSTTDLAAMAGVLERLGPAADDAERIDRIRLLEELKSVVCAAQAKETVSFAASQKGAQVDAGVRAKDVGKGVAAQVALAKREPPARARRYVGWAQILTTELPETYAALWDGRISEWRAQIVARETGWLSAEHRAAVDQELGPRLESLGDRQIEAEAKKSAYRLDPHGYLARQANAEKDRRVSLRPAPDAMTILSGLLPVAQGVAVIAALGRSADSLRSEGDERSRGQIMADTLVERVTGQASASAMGVEVKLVMTDQTLWNHGEGSHEPAQVQGFGPIPAELARRIARAAAETAGLWLRRLYTRPDTGRLVAMESRMRRFEGGLAEFLIVRDQVCRTPWCDAPVRHGDHVISSEDGGATSEGNGQGLCEACNHAKSAIGWRASPGPAGAGGYVETVTPTGHVYRSRAPDPPGSRSRDCPECDELLGRMELRVAS